MSTLGQKIIEFILNKKSFLVLNENKIRSYKNIEAIIFIGSSFCGKSTIVDYLRKNKDIDIPLRYITRPKRLGDNLIENKHVSFDHFNKLNNLWFSWCRNMGNNRFEYYGFEKSSRNSLYIFSANNDLARNKHVIPFDDSVVLWVNIFASSDVREKRLKLRSPDLSNEEIEYRLNDLPEYVNQYSDIIVNNSHEYENYSKQEIFDLISLIVNFKNTP